MEKRELHIVFDGPPGPEGACFVEVEDASGHSVSAGEWRQRPDGYWALVLVEARDALEDCESCGGKGRDADDHDCEECFGTGAVREGAQ